MLCVYRFRERASSVEPEVHLITNDVVFSVSIVENAQCSCQSKENEDNCFSPEVTKGLKCSGRGTCVCGHCVCDTDAANPSKVNR